MEIGVVGSFLVLCGSFLPVSILRCVLVGCGCRRRFLSMAQGQKPITKNQDAQNFCFLHPGSNFNLQVELA